MEAESNERPATDVARKEARSFGLFRLWGPGAVCRQTTVVSGSSWYDRESTRPQHHVRRRDLVEFAVAVLLLTSLIGLLLVGVAGERPATPGPAASPAP